MNKINALIEAGDRFVAKNQGVYDDDYHSELEIATRNALPEIVELVEFARDYRFHRHLKGCPMAVCQDECIDDHIDPTHPFTGNGHECTTCQGVPEDHVCTCGLDRIREICDE